MAAVAPLLAGLEALRRACEEADWALAATLAAAHDRQVREAVAAGADPALAEVLSAQQALIADFVALRDEAAAELRGMQRADGVARAYRDGGGA